MSRKTNQSVANTPVTTKNYIYCIYCIHVKK